MHSNVKFLNAVDMNKQNPDSFFIPSDEEIDEVSIGDFLKVCACHERFWVKVHNMYAGEFTCIVDNDLVFTEAHGINYKDVVTVKRHNIMGILQNDK